MSEIAEQVKQLAQQVISEAKQTKDIKEGSEYLQFQMQIDELTNACNDLFSDIPNSSSAYQEAKTEIISIMKATGEDTIGDIGAIRRIKKEVNTRKLMEALQGDLDHFFVLAKVQQNTLKDFVKGDERKKDLLSCIEVVGSDIVDINISTSLAKDGQ